jgi:hypothetical protein
LDKDLFEYEMKKAGYRTPESRAEAMGVKMSAYYRRTSGECECSNAEIGRVAAILGQEKAWRIFFAKEVS